MLLILYQIFHILQIQMLTDIYQVKIILAIIQLTIFTPALILLIAVHSESNFQLCTAIFVGYHLIMIFSTITCFLN